MVFSGTKQASVKAKMIARAPGSCLVVDFRDSVPPVVWQLDLTKGPVFSIVLKGKDDDWSLGLAEGRGEFTAVARFDNREDAEDAYETVQRAMLKGRSPRSQSVWRWVLSFLVALVILLGAQAAIGLFMGPSGKGESKPQTQMQSLSGPSQAPQAPKVMEPEPGVPVNADDVLKSPQE